MEWLKRCTLNQRSPYISVQPSSCLERLFFDFDSKYEHKNDAWFDCLKLAYNIQREGGEPLIFFTGNRGYHVYVWIWHQPIVYSRRRIRLVREAYRQMVLSLLRCEWADLPERYKTLDTKPLHLNALCRLPFSIHEQTGVQERPVDMDREFMDGINLKFFHDHSLPEDFLRESIIKAKWQLDRNNDSGDGVNFDWHGVRPCLKHALKGEADHDARLAFVIDAYFAGFDKEQIIDCFRVLDDFKESVTRYQVEYTINKIETQGLRPFRERTLKARGICDNSCSKWFKSKALWSTKNISK